MTATLSLPPHRTRIVDVPSPPPLFVVVAELSSDDDSTAERDTSSRFVAFILHLNETRDTPEPWAAYGSPPVEQSRLLGAKPACQVCGRSADVLFSRDAALLRSVNPFEAFRCAEDLDQ